MEDNGNEQFIKFEEELNGLSQKPRNAVLWAMKHFDFVEEICKNTKMTMEEIEEYKAYAKAKEDYIMLLLLCAVQTYENEEN